MFRKDTLIRHSEEPEATKNLPHALSTKFFMGYIAGNERFFTSFRMTAKDTLIRHSEEPEATKNLPLALRTKFFMGYIAGNGRFFTSFRMTASKCFGRK